MPDELWEALEARAAELDRSVAWLVRRACLEYLPGSPAVDMAVAEVPRKKAAASRPKRVETDDEWLGEVHKHNWVPTSFGSSICRECKEVKK